ncbi:MAG: hypothetical protein QG671_133 [Actinomycetota bacterium]|nr:hypothetical protein [Actinomycetota bacterium]
MRLCKVFLPGGERSLIYQQEFEVGRFTVLFGKNNAGKTNILEDIYLMFARQSPSSGEPRIRRFDNAGRLPDTLRKTHGVGLPVGAAYVQLDPDLHFDRAVLDSLPNWGPVEEHVLRFSHLPPMQVCYASTNRGEPELWFTDVRDFYEIESEGCYRVNFPEDDSDEDAYYADLLAENFAASGEDEAEFYRLFGRVDEQQRSRRGPFPRPLFLGWEFPDIDNWVTAAIAESIATPSAWGGIVPAKMGWLEPFSDSAPDGVWRVRTDVIRRLEQVSALATDLLPDFLDGSIRASFHMPSHWQDLPEVRLTYHDGPDDPGRPLDQFGRGASRWMGIAVQIALRLADGDKGIGDLGTPGSRAFSGHVLFIDEPEAHLHHSAVASVVRWCHRLVGCGFNILAATHHEEFLRASGNEVTFVKVTRDAAQPPNFQDQGAQNGDALPARARPYTKVRTIPTTATSALQDLAEEVGMHPATALSLQRAILFVEGPLDEAVLDEYAGPALDAAGVTLIPIHGTKNLEGLIDGELTIRLELKTGVLTDNTTTATIWDRSNTKRSSEEVKLVRLIRRFEEKGLPPPTPFGVAEDDLLFALPTDAIRKFLGRPFPGWHELREEARAAEGLGPSDSVDWKSYALNHYGLPITTTDGVRRIIRALDLAGVELPSIRNVIDEIIVWADKRT